MIGKVGAFVFIRTLFLTYYDVCDKRIILRGQTAEYVRCLAVGGYSSTK